MNFYKIDQNTRNLDVLKFIMAICVVAIHTNPFVKIQGSFFYRVYEAVVFLAVPFFFITTGYLLERKISNNDVGTLDVLFRRIEIVIKCYLVWNVVYLPLAILYYINNSYSLFHDFLNYVKGLLFVGQHYNDWILWYLLSTIYAILFLIVCEKIKIKDNARMTISLVIGLMAVGITLYSRGDIHFSGTLSKILGITKTVFGSGRIFTGVFYIPLGMYIYRFNPSKVCNWLLLATGLIIEIISPGVGFFYEFGRCICAVGLFYAALSMKADKISVDKSLTLRGMSTTIYFIHLWVWTVVYTIIYHKKTEGIIPFVLTACVSISLAKLYEIMKKKHNNN